ncbi:MAG: TetR/AcrR family transcriptional regulator [Actinomycetota bacterium]
MPVQKLTPERRRELTRTALIEAAAEVFAERGLQGSSLDEIADRAGFTRGAIYSNFGSKEELLIAVLEWYGVRTLEAFEAVSREEEWDPATGARTWSDVVHRDPRIALLHVEFELQAMRDPKFRDRLAKLHRDQVERIARFVEDAVKENGQRLKISAVDFAEIGWAASDGLLLFAAIDTEHADRYDRLIGELYIAAFGAWLEPAEPDQPPPATLGA